MMPASPHLVSRETQERLDQFTELLGKWGRRLNLVSQSDLASLVKSRHIGDSLTLVDHIPAGIQRILDLGSGGGFPAIPLAIATGLPVDMIECDHRKAAFLETALATLGLRGTVWPDRIETTSAPASLCVTARALAPLPVLLGYVHRMLLPGGIALLLKGDRAEAEIAEARGTWRMEANIIDCSDQPSRILKISSLEPRA